MSPQHPLHNLGASILPPAWPQPLSAPPTSTLTEGDLPRLLGVWSAASIVINIIIGGGIFRLPSVVAAASGEVGAAMLAWVLGGVIALCGALSYAELATLFPRAGGTYVYIREIYGPLPAFLSGWAWLVVWSTSWAAIALVFAAYAGNFVSLSEWGTRVVAALLILVVAAANCRSVRLGAAIQNISAAAKVIALLGVTAAVFALGQRQGGALANSPRLVPTAWTGFGTALIAALYAYNGWATLGTLAGEVRDPDRTLPRAFVGGTALVTAIYLAVNLAYFYALPFDVIVGSPLVAADAVREVTGAAGASLVAALVMLSTFGALNAAVLAGPRVFYAMAQDGMFFRVAATVHPRYRTPHVATASITLLALIAVASQTFAQLAQTMILGVLPFYALAIGGVLVLRGRSPQLARPYRTPGYPLVPLLPLTAFLALLVQALFQHPARTAASLGYLFLGVPVYLGWRAGGARRADLGTSRVGPP
jgi:APA family basic amino acid/polyamine antiporter